MRDTSSAMCSEDLSTELFPSTMEWMTEHLEYAIFHPCSFFVQIGRPGAASESRIRDSEQLARGRAWAPPAQGPKAARG